MILLCVSLGCTKECDVLDFLVISISHKDVIKFIEQLLFGKGFEKEDKSNVRQYAQRLNYC